MKLLKANRLENTMLIVLTGEERRGELFINKKKKKKSFRLQLDISRHPVVTHFTSSSISPSLPEQRISVWADGRPFRVQSDRMTLKKLNDAGRGTHGCWDSVATPEWQKPTGYRARQSRQNFSINVRPHHPDLSTAACSSLSCTFSVFCNIPTIGMCVQFTDLNLCWIWNDCKNSGGHLWWYFTCYH